MQRGRDGSSIELIRVQMPMVEPLRFAGGVVDMMPITLVRCVAEGVEGWGECTALPAAVPYNGFTAEAEYEALRGFVEGGCREETRLKSMHPPAFASWANATLDCALKAAGESYVDFRGASRASVRVSVAVSLGHSSAIEDWAARGVRAFKCKITPQTTPDEITDVLQRFSIEELGLDANGSFDPANSQEQRTLETLLKLPITYLEQPYAPGAWDALTRLVASSNVPVSVDESLVLSQAMEKAKNAGAMLTLKQSVMGGVEETGVVMERATRAGQRYRLGGMCETGIGRAAVLSLAAHADGLAFAAEVSPDGRWYEVSLVREPFALKVGMLALPTGPGFGVTANHDEIETYRI